MLGVKEDDIALSKLYVGDKLGQLHILQLPEFTLVSTSTISHASLRSMCMNDESELLIADAEGQIFAADTDGKSSLLFETNRSVSSIRVERGTIRIQSGWEQCVYNHDGTLSNLKDASTSFGDNLTLRRMREKRRLRLNDVKLRLNSDCCHRPDWFPAPIEAKQGPVHAKAMYGLVWAMTRQNTLVLDDALKHSDVTLDCFSNMI